MMQGQAELSVNAHKSLSAEQLPVIVLCHQYRAERIYLT